MVVGLAVPMSEGELTEVAELDSAGRPNPFATMLRYLFDPQVGDTAVTLTISGVAHYVYATTTVIFETTLGVTSYRLTQTRRENE